MYAGEFACDDVMVGVEGSPFECACLDCFVLFQRVVTVARSSGLSGMTKIWNMLNG